MSDISDISEQDTIQVMLASFSDLSFAVKTDFSYTHEYKSRSRLFSVFVHVPKTCRNCGYMEVGDEKKCLLFQGDTLREALSKCLEHFGKTATLQPDPRAPVREGTPPLCNT